MNVFNVPEATLHCGDCLEVMATLEADSLDSCVTDAPYHFASIVKRFGKEGSAPPKSYGDGNGLAAYVRHAKGFQGMTWDGGDIAFRPETWAAVLRVLKPGAHLLAFGSSKGSHRMACAIEDAGFEIRDTMFWAYSTGMPKSHNQKGEWGGWGSGLKPAVEPIIMARKPLIGTIAQNLAKYGTGAINVNACRVPSEGGAVRVGEPSQTKRYADRGSTDFATLPGPRGGDPLGRWPATLLHDGSEEVVASFPVAPGQQGRARTDGEAKTNGIYGAMKHAAGTSVEPRGDSGSAARFFWSPKANRTERISRRIEDVTFEWTQDGGLRCVKLEVDLDQSPLRVTGASDSQMAEIAWNTFLFGSGITDLFQKACKFTIKTKINSTTTSPTWNLLTRLLTNASTADVTYATDDGSNPVESAATSIRQITITSDTTVYLPGAGRVALRTPLKISVSAERVHSHPTQKPIALMRYLCRLVTPPGGVVLDPFAGTGTTGQAALAEGFSAVLIEREVEYQKDIRRRLGLPEPDLGVFS